MTKEIEETLLKLKNELDNDERVKEYFRLKEAIINDKALTKLDEDVRLAQKEMVKAINDGELHKQKKEYYETLKKQYENHPLIVSYNNIKDEVYNLLSQISNIINN